MVLRPTLALPVVTAMFACGAEVPPPLPPPSVAGASAADGGQVPLAAIAPGTASALGDASAPSPAPAASAAPTQPPGPPQLVFKPVALPGASAPASLDYIAYDAAHARVWVPVGGTGSADVYDVMSGAFTRVDGFKTAEREYKGKKRVTGPSSVALGDGVAYVGDRASSELCVVDATRLSLGTCLKLASPPDGVAYVPFAKQVWVTTPRVQSLAVFDASKPDVPRLAATLKLEGDPEGYATDAAQGLFLTNLEDKDKTVLIDVKTRKTKATWSLECGKDGPRGLAADAEHALVFVACTDRVLVLDGAHGGAKVAAIDTGAGVDNIDWLAPQRLLYVAAGKDAKLTVVRIDDKGRPTVVASGASTEGARNAVADASGNAYVADPANARLLVFPYMP
jgi:DNA-binding beta-propeller fold protein YncE